MWNNVPDDYYAHRALQCTFCGKVFHASEGGCGCHENNPNHPLNIQASTRGYLVHKGYRRATFGLWEKVISKKIRTARRDHRDGKVKRGQRYLETKTRSIEDETGESYLSVTKRVIRPMTFTSRCLYVDPKVDL